MGGGGDCKVVVLFWVGMYQIVVQYLVNDCLLLFFGNVVFDFEGWQLVMFVLVDLVGCIVDQYVDDMFCVIVFVGVQYSGQYFLCGFGVVEGFGWGVVDVVIFVRFGGFFEIVQQSYLVVGG